MSRKKNATKYQIFAAIDPTVTLIIPELAKEIGLNESIVLMQIAFWIKTSNNIVNNVYWTYQSMTDMQEKAFPYWSIDTIRRIVHKLHKQGYILVGQHNKRKGDNTQWYALEPDKLSTLKSIIIAPIEAENSTPSLQDASMPSSQVATPSLQDRTTLPEIPTEIEKESATSADVKPSKKKREPNPLFNAVAEHIFGIHPDQIPQDDDENSGTRIGIITAWLAGKSEYAYHGRKKTHIGFISAPAQPEHVRLFAGYYKSSSNAHIPYDLMKFVDAWRKWASSRKTAPRRATPPIPVFNESPAPEIPLEERVRMAEESRRMFLSLKPAAGE